MVNLLADPLSRRFTSLDFSICQPRHGKLTLVPSQNRHHCMETQERIMCVVHGMKQALLVLSQLRPSNFSFTLTISMHHVPENIGIIQIRNLFRDHVILQALTEEPNQNKKWKELLPSINSLGEALGNRLQELTEPYIRRCQAEWANGNRKAIKTLSRPLIEFAKDLRLEQLQMAKKIILQNSHKLSPSVGFMYYFVPKTHKENQGSTTCHAFTLQQMQVDGSDMYALWQSWNNALPLNINGKEASTRQDHYLLPNEFLEQFFKELGQIFESDCWDAKTNSLWKKWFGENFFDNVPKLLTKVKLDKRNGNTPTLYLKGLSFSFSFARYNPATIHTDLITNSEEINRFVTEKIELDF